MDKDQIEMTLASTEWSDLPQHLQFNILSRLPVKTLGRCRCVAKDWGQIVDDRVFLKMQFDMAESRQVFLLSQTGVDVLDSEDEDERMDEHHFRFSSVNVEGEVNFATEGKTSDYIDLIPSWYGLVGLIIETKFCVYNPTTRDMKELPDMQPSLTDFIDLGFGYDSSTNEYKVVHLFDRSEDRSKSDIRAELLTVSDGGVINGWRELHESCPFKVDGYGAMANKKFYWIIWTKDASGGEVRKIIRLDMETETFDVISTPNKEVLLDYHNGGLVAEVEDRSIAFYDVKRKIFTVGLTVNDDDVMICLYADSYFSPGTL